MHVFTAFFWGSIVPIMFLWCTLGLIIMYVVERLMIYYSYKRPPILDSSMTEAAIDILFFAPVPLCLVGSWAFSNRAIYFNEVVEVDPDMVYPLSNHAFSSLFTSLDPGTPLIIFTLIFIIVRIIRSRNKDLVRYIWC